MRVRSCVDHETGYLFASSHVDEDQDNQKDQKDKSPKDLNSCVDINTNVGFLRRVRRRIGCAHF